MFNLFHFVCKLLGILSFIVLLLAGCTHPVSSDHARWKPLNNKACKNNAFFQRYHCSIDEVEKAAEYNDPDAEYALGYMYYYGIGSVRDPETAQLWIKRAASRGQPLAIRALNMIEQAQHPQMGEVGKKERSSHPVTTLSPQVKVKPSQPVKMPQTHQKKTLARTLVPALSTQGLTQGMKEEQDILNVHPTHYTLQLIAGSHLPSMKRFIRQHHLMGALRYYQTRFQHRIWYVVIYGDFSHFSEARKALAHLPSGVKKAHPWVKSYQEVQKDMLRVHHTTQ